MIPKSGPEQPTNLELTRIRFWGVRGSIPTPGPTTVKVGGNTACVEIRADGQIIILDAGSGLRLLGLALNSEFRDRPQELTLLITHTHWDHIQGFPFFMPAYQQSNKIRVLGHEGARHGLQAALEGQMESPYFPIALSEMPGNIVFEELNEATFDVGPVHFTTCRTNHPGACYAYRLDTSGGSICYVPDHEIPPDGQSEKNAEVARLLRDSDVAIIDSQYTAEEYREHVGWGHGCTEEVVRVAREARVKQLYLFHHDPSHDDEFVEKMLQRARQLAVGSGMRVETAREGEQVILAPKG